MTQFLACTDSIALSAKSEVGYPWALHLDEPTKRLCKKLWEEKVCSQGNLLFQTFDRFELLGALLTDQNDLEIIALQVIHEVKVIQLPALTFSSFLEAFCSSMSGDGQCCLSLTREYCPEGGSTLKKALGANDLWCWRALNYVEGNK